MTSMYLLIRTGDNHVTVTVIDKESEWLPISDLQGMGITLTDIDNYIQVSHLTFETLMAFLFVTVIEE